VVSKKEMDCFFRRRGDEEGDGLFFRRRDEKRGMYVFSKKG
jgi:hypothetical protein